MSSLHYYAGEGFDVAIMPQAGISLALENDKPARAGGPRSRGGLNVPGAAPTAVVPDVSRFPSTGGDIMPWGDGNDFPQRIAELYRKDPIIPATLGKVSSMLVGRGIMAVEEDLDENGDEVARPLPKGDPVTAEITAFLNNNLFRLYLREMASDVSWFFNGWPELIISKNRQKITHLHPLNAEEVRWCRMDEHGNLPHVYLNANWPSVSADDPYTKKIQALDPYRWDRVDWLRSSSNLYNCVYPISYPTPGNRFYALAHHYAIVESGWLDVHLAIPAFKKYLLKNQMSIKYHLKVDNDYWGELYGKEYTGTNVTDNRRRELRKQWIDGVTKMLTNVENAGAALVTLIKTSLDKANSRDYVQLVPITDTMKDGKYIQDNLEAAANIFYTLGVDPTLVGFAGGEKMGARSGGSDKREAYLIALQMLAPFREMLIEPLEFVAEFNGWKARFPNLRFRYRDTLLTTLDTGAGTQKTLS